MDVKTNPCPPPPPRQPIPKDGFGPRGAPDCYYTSRVLDSTDHYVRFVRKLRIREEEDRIALERRIKQSRDNLTLDFFMKCDRKNIINSIERRVNLCLASYQEELLDKRKRLFDLLTAEEQENIHKFAMQTQAGAEAAFQDKMARLQMLLAKRKKEHEDKYKAIPLGKCSHVQPCIVKIRAKEAQECQLYQMREKQSRKLAEAEFDNMWYELAMKESDTLAARMELDTITRLRRNKENLKFSDIQLEQRRQQRLKDQERLKQEVCEMKAQMDADDKKEEEKQNKLKAKRDETLREVEEMIEDRIATIAKVKAEDKMIGDAWYALAQTHISEGNAQIARRRQMELDLDTCNKKMIEMKNRIAEVKFNSDPMIMAEGQRIRDAADLKRCEARKEGMRQKKINQKAILKQIKDNEEAIDEKIQRKMQEDYQSQVAAQLDRLVKNKEITDLQARKLHQKDLTDQADYNKLLKERAKQEELDQIKKCKIARQEYQESIKDMLARPFFSDEVHPFMKQMAKGQQMRWCPCADDYCAAPPQADKKE